MNIQDQHLRENALNPNESFIVQAPAGSGKTELLTQRFLKLLNGVEKPEEIVAITFTRKAAAEMRQRIIRALSKAQIPGLNLASHEKMTRDLALAALEKDRRNNWNLIENPNRLRVLTIDALCGSICAQTPILSQLGGQPKITDEAFYFYTLASKAFLTDLTHEPEVSEKIDTLLLHLDNRVYQLHSLFTHILSKREQWLSPIMRSSTSESLKKQLETALAAVSHEIINQVKILFSDELQTRVLKQLAFSKVQLNANETLFTSSRGKASGSRNNLDPEALPRDDAQFLSVLQDGTKSQNDAGATTSETIDKWQSIAALLLTQAGTYRKTVNKNQGFPPKHPMKIEMEELLQDLSENESLRHALHEVAQCPPGFYTENQWEILEALLVVLPRLTAQLQVIFAEHGVVDFVELSLRASFALGTEDNPTDLALYLDHQIRHLLIDEFQDTSITQFSLIEKLMSGWVPGDGRSVFLVGDPMQSIYRFREANVGLFLRAQTEGIAGIPLCFIPLCTNFRSDARLVNWFNAHFPALFPDYSDITVGAVPYTPAQAAQADAENSGVFFYPTQDENEEAEQVSRLIQKIHQQNPQETIAILVRSRPHLRHILPVLSKSGIQYHALEIESLGDRPEIQDLLTLTRALLHLGDRLSWLALLRTPFCGLLLADLHRIAQAAADKCIWEILPSVVLSEDGNARLQRIVPILQHIFKEKGRLPLAQWIEGTWIALSGPAVLTEKSEQQNADVFFETLSQLDKAHEGVPLKQLTDTIRKMSATPQTPGDFPIQVMTIHKSKGLEFDHVILPGLAKGTAHDPHQLLLWLEKPNAKRGNDLLLAPIKAAEDESDPIYTYLRKIEKNKANHELIRLLYVALTRAKKTAHCVTQLSVDEKNPQEFAKPSKGSFLELVWDAFSVEINASEKMAPSLREENIQVPQFKRIINSRCHPEQTEVFPLRTSADPSTSLGMTGLPHLKNRPPAFQENISAIIGTLIHLALEKLSLGKTMPDAFWKNQAMMHGLPSGQFECALSHIKRAIDNILSDEKGRWILQPRLSARSEIRISTRNEMNILPLIVDRTFCDEEGIRWIIDYKTSTPQEETLEVFLKKESERYQGQLQQYAKAFAQIEDRPIRLALYFPLIPYYFEIEELVYAV